MISRTRFFLAVSIFLLTTGCATVDFDYPRTESTAFTETADTLLGRTVADQVAAHPQMSGFHRLPDGVEALALRLLMAQQAERSIDIQYFLIHDDLVGRVFLESLLRAADRGVRVRLLLDDIHTGGHDAAMAAIDSHPNLEIRLFNPFAHRSARSLDAFGQLGRITRRMHNKSFTVDNQATIIGGRNIGDEYFGASPDATFGDLDVLAIGPLVGEVSAMFDEYWNHRASLPILALTEERQDPEGDLARVRRAFTDSLEEAREGQYAEAIRTAVQSTMERGLSHLTWADSDLVFDSPDKAQSSSTDLSRSITTSLRETISDIESEMLVVTPYLVLRKPNLEAVRALRDRGIDIAILTNSLASNNHTIAHSGYMPARKPLLEMGVRLYEARADATRPSDVQVDTDDIKTTLHAKAFVVDRRRVFIGTFNWNQRSGNIDTEMGVIIHSPEMAESMAEKFDGLSRDLSYEVFLNDEGKVRWRGQENGEEVILTKEPQTGWWQRFSAGFLRTLPIKSQL